MKKWILLILAALLLVSCAPKSDPVIDEFANCLADKGVKEYASFACSACSAQKNIFGESFNILKEKDVYVECNPKGEMSQSQLCLDNNIEGYPTWIFADGTRLTGVTALWELAEYSGCELNYD